MISNRLGILSEREAPGQLKPFVVSILSGKGGVGKSVIAFNLASELARRQKKTIIIDADWHFGNQHILANVAPQTTLDDIIYSQNINLSNITDINENLRLVASPSLTESAEAFNETDFARFLSMLRNRFAGHEYLIIDTSSGIMELIALAASVADINILVINPELTAIADGYGLYKYILKANRQLSVHILNNRVHNGSEAQYIYQKFSVVTERFLRRLPLDAGYILEDNRVTESIGLQKPIFQLDGASPAGQCIGTLADLILRESGSLHQPKEVEEENINSHKVLADIKE